MSCDPLGGLAVAPFASVPITQASNATVATLASSLARIIIRFISCVSFNLSNLIYGYELCQAPEARVACASTAAGTGTQKLAAAPRRHPINWPTGCRLPPQLA